MVLLNSGALMAWGSNTHYQLGIEAKNTEEQPNPSEVLIEEIKMVACGYEHSLFLDKNGDLYGCGLNDKKQLLYS